MLIWFYHIENAVSGSMDYTVLYTLHLTQLAK